MSTKIADTGASSAENWEEAFGITLALSPFLCFGPVAAVVFSPPQFATLATYAAVPIVSATCAFLAASRIIADRKWESIEAESNLTFHELLTRKP